MGAEKCWHGMQRRGKGGGLENAPPPSRLHKGHPVEPTDRVAHPQALVQMDQIGTVAKQNMLAVVDDLAGPWMLVRRSAAS